MYHRTGSHQRQVYMAGGVESLGEREGQLFGLHSGVVQLDLRDV